MDWTEVCISVPAEQVDRAGAIAHMVVPYGIYIEDYSDIEQGAMDIAHISVESGLIDEALLARDRTKAVIHLYLPPEEPPREAVAFLRERFGAEGIAHDVTTAQIGEDDWANNWKQFFKPTPVGNRFMICPTWIEPPPLEGRRLLRIDPGMAFGTGGHHTTRLVLEMMEDYIKGGETVLDIGCGSGILSVAALLLGARSATGIDIDSVAVRTAEENGLINGMKPPAYTVRSGNLASDVKGVYNVVVANIVADAIISLSPDVPRFLAGGGVYIVSGIIDDREEDVLQAVKQNSFTVIEKREHSGWVAIALGLS